MGAKILGVLAGDDLPMEALAPWLASAEIILAADGGADHVLAAGFAPSWVVGDFDSLVASRDSFSQIREIPDQSLTDCDKLLALAVELGFEAITLACVEGSRPDHALATLQSAARSPLEVRFVFRKGLGWIVKPGFSPRCVALGRVSLLPLILCSGASLSGVRWPLDGAALDPLGLTSISNEGISNGGSGEVIEASLESGAAFLFIEHPAEVDPSW